MPSRKTDFLNGVPELVVLRLLAERPMYGYELVQAIKRKSEDGLAFGEGVVYPLLHALQRGGYLSAKRESTGARPRVYYRLTAKGRKRLAKAVTHWQSVNQAIAKLLGSEAALD